MIQHHHNQIKALITLLGHEKGAQAVLLKEELARIMQQDSGALKQVIEQDFHASIPAALADAMQEIYWDQLTAQIAQFNDKINPDLEEALWLATCFANPAYTRAEITRQLDELARTLQPLLANCTALEDILHTLDRFFFHLQCYYVLPAAHNIKELSFGHFLQKKRGAALCLCSLYTVCAERFGLDAGIIDLAGRLLIRLQTPDAPFPVFADPLRQGKLFTVDACKNYILARNLEWNDAFIVPLSSRMILRRIFSHMIFILNKLRDERRLTYLRRYMDILKD